MKKLCVLTLALNEHTNVIFFNKISFSPIIFQKITVFTKNKVKQYSFSSKPHKVPKNLNWHIWLILFLKIIQQNRGKVNSQKSKSRG